MAIAAGASALGLVSAMPSGPGVIEEALIKKIAQSCPPGVSTFLLTSLTEPDAIIAQIRYCETNTVQLVDAVDPDAHLQIKRALPNIKIVQVIHVLDDAAVSEARAYTDTADALLLDSGNPSLATKELGGTGRIHNWEISREIVERSRLPVFLAGGLNPDNAAHALSSVRPYGLDICSGVRSSGRLDPGKLMSFIRNSLAAG